MMAEGIHSLVDTGNQGLLLYGIRRASQPADKKHPFGYGAELYFWAFVVALLIFAVGAGLSIYEGIHKVLEPTEIADPTINFVVLALAICFEGWAWMVAFKEFSTTKGKKGWVAAVRTPRILPFSPSCLKTQQRCWVWLSQASAFPSPIISTFHGWMALPPLLSASYWQQRPSCLLMRPKDCLSGSRIRRT